MLLILLSVALIIQTLFFKPRPGVLCCGLFGGSFNSPITEHITRKLKVLGYFNQSRGEDSCGYYNGDILKKGVGEEKKFFDFVVKNGLDLNDNGNHVFIGHVRKSTVGSNIERNAHPFLINDRFVLAHNGTLSNHYGLCTKYGVDTKDLWVDSQMLATLIDKEGYKVLEEYKGYAALLMHNTDEPGTLLIYHGASKDKSTDTNLWIERPLFYMQTAEGVYVSSMTEPLQFIREAGDGEIIDVPCNKVIPIRNGVVGKIRRVIERSEMNIVVPTPYAYSSGYYNGGAHASRGGAGTNQNFQKEVSSGTQTTGGGGKVNGTGTTQTNLQLVTTPSAGTNASKGGKRTVVPKSGTFPPFAGIDIRKETVPGFAFNSDKRVYYSRNRFYDGEGVPLSGIVTIDKMGDRHFIFDATSALKHTLYYFHKGVMLRDSKAYTRLVNLLKQSPQTNEYTRKLSDNKYNYAMALSIYARYPVTNVSEQECAATVEDRNLYYLDGKPARGSITPVFSDRTYHFSGGALFKVVPMMAVADGGKPKEKFFLDNTEGIVEAVNGAYCADYVEKCRSSKKIEFESVDDQGLDAAGSDSVAAAGGGDDSAEYTAWGFTTIKKLFTKTYPNAGVMSAEFNEFAKKALRLYVEAVIKNFFDVPEPSENAVEMYMKQIFNDALVSASTIEEQLQYIAYDIDTYIWRVVNEAEPDDDDVEHEDVCDTSADLFIDTLPEGAGREGSYPNSPADSTGYNAISTDRFLVPQLQIINMNMAMNKQQERDLIDEELKKDEALDEVEFMFESVLDLRRAAINLKEDYEDVSFTNTFADLVLKHMVVLIGEMQEAAEMSRLDKLVKAAEILA